MTSGRSSGTFLPTMVVEPNDPSKGGFQYALLGYKVIFAGYNSVSGTEPWYIDGSNGEIGLFSDINPGTDTSYLSDFTQEGNRLFFRADDGISGYELWVTDSTSAGTMRLADIYPGGGGPYPE